ncbi:glycosyltransferase family 4 protein [Candidatus Symbiothrix dinenymphae]|uniref:glycosyltransferase family 4 protein n=1 Tax=Candidatus Symbiothrix dinenymphae TaxID=467085 RepID=UPI0006C60CE1|nr:glycosyltransferase family 1 protein [Candidatus Symbiothrix dinenymphae]GAP71861.1 mannosyltransferase [Candidatus Symbiothrix dinenymphae]
MRIGFDAKRAVQNNTGLGNYSRYVIETVSDYFSDNHYVCFAPKKKENSRLKTILARTDISFVFPREIFKLFPSLWRLFGVKRDIKEQKIAVFHGLSNELPVGIEKTCVKTVVTIHDLIFLHYPEYYKPIDRKIYRAKFKRACEKADKIIAVSECTKRDIIAFFHIPEEKIEVVYQGCHPNFRRDAPASAPQLEKYNLPHRFILSVGSIEARKNLLLPVKALSKIPEDVHLVAVGKPTPYQAEVEVYAAKKGLSTRLHILNNVAFEDLPAIYQSAAVFVYPSFFEGFGIPIIEALSCGVPVIAATGSCLEEAGGPDSVYIAPNDDAELAKKINTILGNKGLSDSMIAAGKTYVQRFSEKAIAEQLMQIYRLL